MPVCGKAPPFADPGPASPFSLQLRPTFPILALMGSDHFWGSRNVPELKRILHVEDDPDIREIVNICLATMGGFDLMQCDGGAQALERAEAFAPDLFLFDLMMPGMSGIDTLKALRQIPSLASVPAIFCTSVNVAEEFKSELRALSVGAVQKPFDPMTLAQKITNIWNDYHTGH